MYYCCCYCSYIGECKTSKTRSFSVSQPISSQRHGLTKMVLCQSIVSDYLAVFTPIRALSTEQWQHSGLSWMPKVRLQTVSHLNLFIWIQRRWGSSSEAAALGVWPGNDLKLPGSEEGSFPFPVTGKWWHSQLGGKRAMLAAVGRMDPVCFSWKQVWIWLSCGEQFVGYVLMADFEGRGYSGQCGGVEKRRKMVVVWGCQLWEVLWELAFKHFVKYVKVSKF